MATLITRSGLVAVAIVLMVGGCELLEPEEEYFDPPPPPRAQASTCVQRVDDYVTRHRTLASVMNARYQNDCRESVEIRVSATLYTLPARVVVDRVRFNVTVPGNATRWLCGNGAAESACAFRSFTPENFAVTWRERMCYIDEACVYAQYPDPG